MGINTNISYFTIQTAHADEAESLAFYLNEHGICAQVKERDSVELPVLDADSFGRVEMLKATWQLFWDTSDSGLFGLPLYVKD
jgi:hypothetical protein